MEYLVIVCWNVPGGIALGYEDIDFFLRSRDFREVRREETFFAGLISASESASEIKAFIQSKLAPKRSGDWVQVVPSPGFPDTAVQLDWARRRAYSDTEI
jgi:hypothetical protein